MSLVSANKTDTNIYTLEIGVSAEDFKAAVQKSYLKERKSIQLPGFRKGKAPRQMIERLYGEDFFYEGAFDLLASDEIFAAYEEANITPVDQPKNLDIKTMNIAEGLTFTIEVTVKPEITLNEYKGIEAEKAVVEVTDEDIEGEIQYMLERGARLVDVSDRAVENGDIAVIDFQGFVDGVAFEGGKAEKYNLTIGDGQFVPGFEEQIIGHKAGDEFDINVTFPEDYAPELASKQAVFQIKLHEVKIKEFPELDDEFAKDQDYDTVADLREGVKEDITARRTESANRAFEDTVFEKLCEAVEGEIPECMFDNKAKQNIEEFTQRVSQQGIPVDMYLQYMGMDMEGLKTTMRERAVNDVKYELAIEKIIELEGLKAENSAVEEEYKKMAEQYNMEVEQVKKAVPTEIIAEQLNKQAAFKLVLDSAKSKTPKAKKTTKKAEESKEPEKKAPAKKTATKKDSTQADKNAPAKKNETETEKKAPAKKTTAKKDETEAEKKAPAKKAASKKEETTG